MRPVIDVELPGTEDVRRPLHDVEKQAGLAIARLRERQSRPLTPLQEVAAAQFMAAAQLVDVGLIRADFAGARRANTTMMELYVPLGLEASADDELAAFLDAADRGEADLRHAPHAFPLDPS